jgi:pyruvate carboxylase
MKKIHKLFFANRGEMATCAMRAATELGIRTVAIYPDHGHKLEKYRCRCGVR